MLKNVTCKEYIQYVRAFYDCRKLSKNNYVCELDHSMSLIPDKIFLNCNIKDLVTHEINIMSNKVIINIDLRTFMISGKIE